MSSGGAGGELLMKTTSEVEWSRPYVLRRWEHRAARLDEGPSAQDHGLHPPDDKDASVVTQTRQRPLQQTSYRSPCLRAYGKAKSHQRTWKVWDEAGCFLIHSHGPYI